MKKPLGIDHHMFIYDLVMTNSKLKILVTADICRFFSSSFVNKELN